MSWLGWLFLLAALYLFLLLIRGFLHLAAWLANTFTREPSGQPAIGAKGRRQLADKAPRRESAGRSTAKTEADESPIQLLTPEDLQRSPPRERRRE